MDADAKGRRGSGEPSTKPAKGESNSEGDHNTSSAMNIMMKLQGNALNAVYGDFKTVFDAEGRGLSLTEFVSSVLRHLLEESAISEAAVTEPPDLVALTKDLVDVFQQIDVNGDQSLEWEEFAAFAIESGNASSGAGRAVTFTVMHDPLYADVVTRTTITGAQYLPEVDCIVVLELGLKTVRLYSSNLLLVRNIDSSIAIRSSRRAEDRSMPIATTLCLPKPDQPILAVLLSNGIVGLWRLDDDETCPFYGVLPRPALGYAPVSIHWESGRKRLLLGCTNGSILSYNVSTKTPVAQLDGHKDVIVSMASAPRAETFFTSSLDGTILSWSADTNKVKRPLRGHEALGAVTRFCMIEGLDTVYGIAGGAAVLGWDVGADVSSVKLGPGVHHAKIVDIAAVQTTPPRLASVDEDGVVAVWEISASFMGGAPLITQFQADSLGSFKPSFLVMTSPPHIAAERRMALKLPPETPAERLKGASEALMAAVAEKQAEAAAAIEASSGDLTKQKSQTTDHKKGKGARGKGMKDGKGKDLKKLIGGDMSDVLEDQEAAKLKAAAALKAKAKAVEIHNMGHRLGVAGDMIVCGARMFRYVTLPTSRADAPVAAIYNPVFLRFITAVGRDISTWAAGTGRISDVFFGATSTPHDITCMTFDDRRRKLFIGTGAGRVEALNLANGAHMKDGRLQSGAVADLIYVDEDRLLVASGWDGSLVVYDDEPGDLLDPLRSVTYAHEGDITALAVSSELAFIITGDKTGCVRAWDYQDLKMLAQLNGHRAIVTAVCTFGALPIAATADGDGQVILWSTRGYAPPPGTAGHRFQAWSRLYSFSNMVLLREVYDPLAVGTEPVVMAEQLNRTATRAGFGLGMTSQRGKDGKPSKGATVTWGNSSLASHLPGHGATGSSSSSPAKREPARKTILPGAKTHTAPMPALRTVEMRKAARLAARAAAFPRAPDGQLMIAGMKESDYRAILDSKVKLGALIEQILEDISAARDSVDAGTPNKKRGFRINYDMVQSDKEKAMAALKARLRIKQTRVDTAVTGMRSLVPVHAEPDDAAATTGTGQVKRFNKPVILTIGDDSGRISVLDILPILRRLGVTPVPVKDSPRSLASFNPHRRTHRDEPGPVITDEGYFYSADVSEGPKDVTSLAHVDIDLILALEKGRSRYRSHRAVGLGQEVEAKQGKPARRASLLAAVGAEVLAKVVSKGEASSAAATAAIDASSVGATGSASASFSDDDETAKAFQPPASRRGSNAGEQEHTASADAMMAKLQASIEAAAAWSGQGPLKEVIKRPPTLAERRALIAKEGAQADPDAIRPLLALDGVSGIGIVSSMNRRGSIEARRIMRRASLEAGVQGAVSRDTIETIAARPSVRSLVGTQAVNRPDGPGFGSLMTVEDDLESMAKELPKQPGDIRELHVIPQAHVGAVVSMQLVEVEHVSKASADVTNAFLIDPIQDVPPKEPKIGPNGKVIEEVAGPDHLVPALAGYYLTSTGADARVLVWDLVQGIRVGQLGQTADDEERASQGLGPLYPWIFPSPGPELEARAREEATQLLESVDAAAEGSILGSTHGSRPGSPGGFPAGASEARASPSAAHDRPDTQGTMGQDGSATGIDTHGSIMAMTVNADGSTVWWDSASQAGPPPGWTGDGDTTEAPHGTMHRSPSQLSMGTRRHNAAASMVTTATVPRPGRTLADEQFLIDQEGLDTADRVRRQARLVEILPRRECKIEARKLHLNDRPGGAFIASTYLKDVLEPLPSFAAIGSGGSPRARRSASSGREHGPDGDDDMDEGGEGGSKDDDDEEEEDDLDVMLPAERLMEFDPQVLKETGGWSDGTDKVAIMENVAGPASGVPGLSKGQTGNMVMPSFATILSSTSPAGLAAEALGPAAATVLGLTGYDTTAETAKKAVGRAAVKLRQAAPALNAAMSVRPGTSASSSMAMSLMSSGMGSMDRRPASPGVPGGMSGRALQIVAQELRSSARNCGLRTDKLNTIGLTATMERMAMGEHVARLGHGKPLDTATAMALVAAVGGLKQEPPENVTKITGMYGHMEAERLRNKLGFKARKEEDSKSSLDLDTQLGSPHSSRHGHSARPVTHGSHVTAGSLAADGKEEGEQHGFPSITSQLSGEGWAGIRSPLRSAALSSLGGSPHGHGQSVMSGRAGTAVPGSRKSSVQLSSPTQQRSAKPAPVNPRLQRMDQLLAALDGPSQPAGVWPGPSNDGAVSVALEGSVSDESMAMGGVVPTLGAPGTLAATAALKQKLAAVREVLTSRSGGRSPRGRGKGKGDGFSGRQDESSSDEESPKNADAMYGTQMPSYFGPYSSLEVLRARRVFVSADTDGSGDVSLEELLAQPEWRRVYSHEQITGLFEAMDTDASGRVTAAELFAVMFPKVDAQTRKVMLYWSDPRRTARLAPPPPAKAKQLTARQRAEADGVFEVLDGDRDGYVTMMEVRDMVVANVSAQGRKKAVDIHKNRPTGPPPLDAGEVPKTSPATWTLADLEAVFRLYAKTKVELGLVPPMPVPKGTQAVKTKSTEQAVGSPSRAGTADGARSHSGSATGGAAPGSPGPGNAAPGSGSSPSKPAEEPAAPPVPIADLVLDRPGFYLLWADIYKPVLT